MKLAMNSRAILLWVDKGKSPKTEDFNAPEQSVHDASRPQGKSPEPYWTLEGALTHATEVMRYHDKEPWIKTEDSILGPEEINQAMAGLRAMKMFDKKRN
jgi:hypothetical protein